MAHYVRTHGAFALLGGASDAVRWRVRDALWARRFGAPGFQAARSPRILGWRHIHLGPEFHARDFLWLEAVTGYQEGSHKEAFTPELRIGASARLSDNVHIGCLRRITIGDHLLCGSRVLISDHGHGQYAGEEGSDPAVPPAQRPLHSRAPVRIGNNVWLGDGVVVLAGADIGDGCVVGANSVVTGPVPPGTVVAGSPARVLRRWDGAARRWLPVS